MKKSDVEERSMTPEELSLMKGLHRVLADHVLGRLNQGVQPQDVTQETLGVMVMMAASLIASAPQKLQNQYIAHFTDLLKINVPRASAKVRSRIVNSN